MVLPRRPQAHTGAVVEPQSSPLGLLRRHPKPLLSPYPLDPLVVYMPTTMPQQGGDPPVAVPAETGWPAPRSLRSAPSPHPRGAAHIGGWTGDEPGSCRHAARRLRKYPWEAAKGRAEQFPFAASLSILLSSVRSATALFRRLFSDSRRLRRVAPSILRPPYALHHRQKVCWVTPIRRAALVPVPLSAIATSASLSLLITCSGVWLLSRRHRG